MFLWKRSFRNRNFINNYLTFEIFISIRLFENKRKKKFYSSKLLYWNSTEFSTKEKKKTILFSPNFLFSIPLNYETRKNQNSIFLSTKEGNLRLYYLNIFKYFKATPKTQFFTETFPIRIFFSLFSPFKIVKYSKPPIQFFTGETKSLLSSIIFLFFFFFFFHRLSNSIPFSSQHLSQIQITKPLPIDINPYVVRLAT